MRLNEEKKGLALAARLVITHLHGCAFTEDNNLAHECKIRWDHPYFHLYILNGLR
jgi:hypothetical protein